MKNIKGDHMMHDIIRIDYGYRIYCIYTSKCDAIQIHEIFIKPNIWFNKFEKLIFF